MNDKGHSKPVLEKLKAVEALLNDIKGAPTPPRSGLVSRLERVLELKLAVVVLIPVLAAIFTYLVNLSMEDRKDKSAVDLVKLQGDIQRKIQVESEAQRAVNAAKLEEIKTTLTAQVKNLDEKRSEDERARSLAERQRGIAREIDMRLALMATGIHPRIDPHNSFKMHTTHQGGQSAEDLPGQVVKDLKRALSQHKGTFVFVSTTWSEYSLSALFSELFKTAPKDEKLLQSLHDIAEYTLEVTLDDGSFDMNKSYATRWAAGICKRWAAYRAYLGGATLINFQYKRDPKLDNFCVKVTG